MLVETQIIFSSRKVISQTVVQPVALQCCQVHNMTLEMYTIWLKYIYILKLYLSYIVCDVHVLSYTLISD